MSFLRVPLGKLIKPAIVKRAGNKEYPVLSMTMHRGLVDQEAKFKKRVASADTSTYKVVDRGQLVVGFPIDEGVLAFQQKYDAAIVSPAYNIWDLNDEVDRSYLQRFLRSSHALHYYRSKLRGTTARRRTLPNETFLGMMVPIPSPAEQRRIAAVLDQADALRAMRREVLAQLDDLTQSIFLDMFDDPSTNPMGWKIRQAGDVVDSFRNGLSPSKAGKFHTDVLTLSAVTGREFDPDARKSGTFDDPPPRDKLVNMSDLLICRGNGNISLVGKAYFPHESAEGVVFPDTIIAARFEPGQVSERYLEAVWNSVAVRRQIESAARTTNGTHKVNQAALKKIAFPVPPAGLQQEFARWVEAVEPLKAAHRAHLAALDELFGSLQNRAFRGEL